jgi:methanogenic corrinoid protein MtbC1
MGITLKGWQTMTHEEIEHILSPEMEKLASLVAQLKEQEVLAAIEQHLGGGISPPEVLAACQKGMRLVGSMHEEGIYYIAGLIMAGEIMRQAVDLLKPLMIKARSSENVGRVLLGTISGDIHDIGKNLFRDLLECHGFTVLDLGVDVPPEEFVKAAETFRPHLVAVSALITDSFPRLRELVELFEDTSTGRAKRPVIMIGGGQVDDVVHRMSGSDFWTQDALAGVKLCQRLMGELKRSEN